MKSSIFEEITSLITEQNNPKTREIDTLPTEEILKLINDEDKLVPLAVEKAIPRIAVAVEVITEAFRKGGRLFYVGAGTSGRLGILDASECPPTFNTPPEMVQGIIAGGNKAVFQAVEGAEDSEKNGREIIEQYGINKNDVVCGIAASGRTPFVKGCLLEAKKHGIKTILITTSTNEKVNELGIEADVIISAVVGPEVIAGSTRMKSGTAQKLILNMLSTASMIKLGKTYGNIMIDLQLKNNKLRERAKKILMDLAKVSYEEAEQLLKESGGSVKTALVMKLANVSFIEAKKALENSEGLVKKAVELLNKEKK